MSAPKKEAVPHNKIIYWKYAPLLCRIGLHKWVTVPWTSTHSVYDDGYRSGHNAGYRVQGSSGTHTVCIRCEATRMKHPSHYDPDVKEFVWDEKP